VYGSSRPDTQFVWHGDVALAYQVVGDGPIDLVYLQGIVSNVELNWDHPSMGRFLIGLARNRRLIVTDARGWGCSERSSPHEPWPIEVVTEDLGVVLDAVGSHRAVIMASNDCAFAAMLFAATYPDRTAGLILYEASANWMCTEETPWEWTAERWNEQVEDFRTWTREDAVRETALYAPSMASDARYIEWW
jgi:pimeloyl-ACP methyl ester carboxylesterase